LDDQVAHDHGLARKRRAALGHEPVVVVVAAGLAWGVHGVGVGETTRTSRLPITSREVASAALARSAATGSARVATSSARLATGSARLATGSARVAAGSARLAAGSARLAAGSTMAAEIAVAATGSAEDAAVDSVGEGGW